jgi:hypothetical protein
MPMQKAFYIKPGATFGTLNPDVSQRGALVVANSQPTDYYFLPKDEIQAALLRKNTALLQQQPLFQYFTSPQLKEMCKMCTEKMYKPGSYILEQVVVQPKFQ